MGIEKPANIWQPCNRSEFRSNHAWNFWYDSLDLVDQIWKAIMFEILLYYMFAYFV